jgi:hypothetical protein
MRYENAKTQIVRKGYCICYHNTWADECRQMYAPTTRRLSLRRQVAAVLTQTSTRVHPPEIICAFCQIF